MFCKLISYCVYGIDATSVTVEIDLSDGLPSFDIVGLPDSAVKESRERVKSAIKNSGYIFPIGRITINLAPADIRKEGGIYDLPIAIGILGCIGVIGLDNLQGRLVLGELALDGNIRPVRGILPIICGAIADSVKEVLIPRENTEAMALTGTTLYYFSHLKEVVAFLNGEKIPSLPSEPTKVERLELIDYADVKGQERAKRALVIAAAGYHNLLFIGAPGSGKTMLAQRMPTILPELSPVEHIEVAKIYNIANYTSRPLTSLLRPFRAPHHTTSLYGLVGGGISPKPGEISLAHHGVLFLDELLEFPKKAIDLLRQPLENHEITISRANATFTYPSKFLLLTATNPCPCGYYPDIQRCTCDLPSVKRYLKKLSGPIIDRIELQVEIKPMIPTSKSQEHIMSSEEMKQQVMAAQKIQQKRFLKDNFVFNSHIPAALIDKYCVLTSEARDLLTSSTNAFHFTARSYHKILKLSRTIADLDAKVEIEEEHIIEAMGYRLLDRKFLQ